jgi:hypothetical protein
MQPGVPNTGDWQRRGAVAMFLQLLSIRNNNIIET